MNRLFQIGLPVILFVSGFLVSKYWVGNEINQIDENFALEYNFDRTDYLFDPVENRYSKRVFSKNSVNLTGQQYNDSLKINTSIVWKRLSGDPIYNLNNEYIGGKAFFDNYGNVPFLCQPFKGKKDSITFFHYHYKSNFKLGFDTIEEIYGFKLHKFSGQFSAQIQRFPDIKFPTKNPITVKGNLSIWIDPATGLVINLNEKGENFEHTDQEIIKFLGKYTIREDRLNLRKLVGNVRKAANDFLMYQLYIPIGCLIFLLLISVREYVRLMVSSDDYLKKYAPAFTAILILIIGGGASYMEYQDRLMERDQTWINRFESDVNSVVKGFRNEVEDCYQILETMRFNYSHVNFWEYEDFCAVAEFQIHRSNALTTVEWVPRVRPNERKIFENFAENLLGIDFRIYPISDSKKDLFPVFMISPLNGNEKAMGYDLNTDIDRSAALNQAITQRNITATKVIKLVQDDENKTPLSVLVFNPVYSKNDELMGLFTAIFDIYNMIDAALSVASHLEGVKLTLIDGLNDELLSGKHIVNSDNCYVIAENLLFFNRELRFKFTKVKEPVTMSDYLVLVLGLSLSLILAYLFYQLMSGSRNELIRAHDELTRQNIELEEKTKLLLKTNKELQQFTYIASHDINAPVANLSSLLEIFQKHTTLETKPKAILEKIESAVKRLTDTIGSLNEVLEFKDEMTLDATKLHLEEELWDVIVDLQNVIQPVDPEIKSKFEVEELYFPKIHLRHIYQNLITNAIKYRNPDRPLVIEVSTHQEVGWLKFSFKDNGKGFDMDLVGYRIFGLFKRFDQKTAGKGIGLYIMKNIIDFHRGNIEVKSAPDKGTEFIIYLPILEKD